MLNFSFLEENLAEPSAPACVPVIEQYHRDDGEEGRNAFTIHTWRVQSIVTASAEESPEDTAAQEICISSANSGTGAFLPGAR